VLALIACFLAAPLARAHDPYEAWTFVNVSRNALELNITMAQSTALQLVDPEKTIRGLTVENFPAQRARFEREAATLYIITSIRTPLKPRKIAVELTEENDVAFKIIYPRPAPGRLHFHAAFLKKLGEGFGGIIEATDNEGHHLGWEQVSVENPNLEVEVPPPSPEKPPAKK
jgi:hypothetical protein